MAYSHPTVKLRRIPKVRSVSDILGCNLWAVGETLLSVKSRGEKVDAKVNLIDMILKEADEDTTVASLVLVKPKRCVLFEGLKQSRSTLHKKRKWDLEREDKQVVAAWNGAVH